MQPCHSLIFPRGASHNLKSHSTMFGLYPFSRLANRTQALKDVNIHVHIVHGKVQQYAVIASLCSELWICIVPTWTFNQFAHTAVTVLWNHAKSHLRWLAKCITCVWQDTHKMPLDKMVLKMHGFSFLSVLSAMCESTGPQRSIISPVYSFQPEKAWLGMIHASAASAD